MPMPNFEKERATLQHEHDQLQQAITDLGPDGGSLLLTLEETRKDIADALAKLADGRYGKCERCSRAISEARLAAMPAAKLCVDCGAAEEEALEDDATAEDGDSGDVRRASEADGSDTPDEVDVPGETTDAVAMKVWIDQDLCTGAGECVRACPRVFELVDGVSRVKEGAQLMEPGPNGLASVPPELKDAVLGAVDACPSECIFIEID